jgi:hypothetical protein
MSVRVLIAAAALAGGAACQGSEPEAATSDRRQPLPLPVEAQDAVRTEMNGMLRSLNGILLALSRDDTAGIRSAAAASGLGTAADPALEQLLPEQFLTWATQTHQGFDSLAAAVTRGYARDSVLHRVATITGMCVTCHATYRLAPMAR